jgi:hypothetical protein
MVNYDGKLRELAVPCQKPTAHPPLLDIYKFSRLKWQAKVNISLLL